MSSTTGTGAAPTIGARTMYFTTGAGAAYCRYSVRHGIWSDVLNDGCQSAIHCVRCRRRRTVFIDRCWYVNVHRNRRSNCLGLCRCETLHDWRRGRVGPCRCGTLHDWRWSNVGHCGRNVLIRNASAARNNSRKGVTPQRLC